MSGKIVTVDFRSDTLFAVERDDGVYVAVAPICRSLGISVNKQRERIQNDPVLSEGGTVTVLPSTGGMQDTFCLRLDLINGWLFTIDASRVKDDVRPKIIEYQRECHRVLFQHFYGKATGTAPLALDEPEESESVRLRMVTEARQTFGARAGAELWFKLGLPIVPAMLHDPRQMTIDYAAIKAADQNIKSAEPDKEPTAA